MSASGSLAASSLREQSKHRSCVQGRRTMSVRSVWQMQHSRGTEGNNGCTVHVRHSPCAVYGTSASHCLHQARLSDWAVALRIVFCSVSPASPAISKTWLSVHSKSSW